MHNTGNAGQIRVQEVVEAAWRRRSLVLAVQHSALAFAAIFAGLVLLLLLGTQILSWPWLLLLGAIGISVAVLRMRKQILDRYSVAQLVDHRLGLSDTLSTAWFLIAHNRSLTVTALPSFAAAQIGRANETAATIEPALVFPFVWQRAWLVTAGLAVVAFGMFAVRYLVTDSLDLKQSLITLNLDPVTEVFERIERWSHPHPNGKGSEAVTAHLHPRRGASPDGPRDPQLDDQKRGGPSTSGRKANSRSPNDTGSSPENTKAGQQAPGGQSKTSGQSPLRDSGNQQNPNPTGAPSTRPDQTNVPDAQESPRPRQSSGVIDRMKDALSGMMAKVRPQEKSGQKKADASDSKQESKQNDQASANAEQKSPAERTTQNSSANQSQSQQQSSQGQSEAQASEKNTGAQSHASDESADRKGSDAHSGVGRQDGEKSTKEAEQLRAIGKIEEIIGKRSATLTGDMTIETRSGHQPLQTQYSGRVGHHADLGREIDRDEVPLALQNYVREYMEQVRKQGNVQ